MTQALRASTFPVSPCVTLCHPVSPWEEQVLVGKWPPSGMLILKASHPNGLEASSPGDFRAKGLLDERRGIVQEDVDTKGCPEEQLSDSVRGARAETAPNGNLPRAQSPDLARAASTDALPRTYPSHAWAWTQLCPFCMCDMSELGC